VWRRSPSASRPSKLNPLFSSSKPLHIKRRLANMAENAPPGNNASNSDSSRGMPYYDRLRRDLRDLLQKKRAADANIVRPQLQLLPCLGLTHNGIGSARRTDIQHRDRVPRADNSRQHHQRLRQLRKGLFRRRCHHRRRHCDKEERRHYRE
jgi:hypothetical protein